MMRITACQISIRPPDVSFSTSPVGPPPETASTVRSCAPSRIRAREEESADDASDQDEPHRPERMVCGNKPTPKATIAPRRQEARVRCRRPRARRPGPVAARSGNPAPSIDDEEGGAGKERSGAIDVPETAADASSPAVACVRARCRTRRVGRNRKEKRKGRICCTPCTLLYTRKRTKPDRLIQQF
jgi:hypothetical protein